MTRFAQLSMAVRNTLQLRLKLDRNNVALQEQYKHQRNIVTSLLRNAEQQYYCGQFLNNRSNSAAIWNIIKNIVPNKTINKQHQFRERERT